MAGVEALTSSVAAGLLQQAETDTGTSATLLKKAANADADLVAKLLPIPPAPNSSLNVRA